MAFGENLKWLIAKRGVAVKAIADFIEVKPNTISNYINGVSTPNYELLGKLVKFLDVTSDEILYGDLPTTGLIEKVAPNVAPIAAPNYQKQEKNANEIAAEPMGAYATLMPKVVTVDSDNKEVIILVAHKAAAGYLNGYADPEYIETLPTFTIPGFKGNSLRAFEVYGESMLPTHHSGSIAIGQAVEKLHHIRDRRVYIIVTRNDGIVLKRVLNRINQDGKLILISDNLDKKRYDNIVIDAEDVLELWYWRASIIRQSPEPSPLYTKLNELEAKVSLHDHYLKSKGLLGDV